MVADMALTVYTYNIDRYLFVSISATCTPPVDRTTIIAMHASEINNVDTKAATVADCIKSSYELLLPRF